MFEIHKTAPVYTRCSYRETWSQKIGKYACLVHYYTIPKHYEWKVWITDGSGWGAHSNNPVKSLRECSEQINAALPLTDQNS